MRTGIKAVLLVAGIISALVVCLVIGLHFYVKTDSAQKFVLAKINEAIPGSLSWQELRSSLLKGRLEIVAGVLSDPEGKQLVGVDDLFINLAWFKLIRGEVVIEEARIAAPLVDLGPDREGNLALVGALYSPGPNEPPVEKEKQGVPFNVVVEELTLSDGTVLYQAMDGSSRAEVSGIDITADADLFAEALNFTAQASRASYTGGEIRADLQKFLASASVHKDVIAPIVVQAQTGFSQVSVKGSIRDIPHKPFFTLAADVAMSLPEIRETLALSAELTGEVKARLEVKGTLENPEVRAQLVYPGGSLGGQQIKSAQLDAVLKDKVVVLERAHAAIASGEITARGRADLGKAFPEGFFSGERDLEAISYTVRVNGEGIDLAKLLPAAVPLKGVAGSVIELSGTGISPDFLSARLRAELVCKKLSFDKTVPPVDVSLTTSAGIEKGRVRVENLEVRSGRNTLEAAGRVDLPAGTIDARIKLDMPELRQDIRPFGIDGNGRLGLVAHVSQSLYRPAFEFSLEAGGLSIDKITIGDIVCAAGLDSSGMLTVSRFALENRGSRIEGSGAVGIYNKPLEFTTDAPVNFTANLTQVELKDFMDVPDSAGTLNGELSVGGTMAALNAVLALNGQDLSVQNVRIGDIQVSSRYDEGILALEEVVIQNRKSYLHATGAAKIFDQDSRRYLADPEISLVIQGRPVFLQDIVDRFKGRVSFTGNVMGTLGNPKGEVSLSGKQLDLGFQKIDNFEVAAKMDGSRFILDTLRVVPAQGEVITGTGWVSLEKEYAFDLAAQGISLGTIQVLQDIHNIEGRIALALSGQGTFDNPAMHGEGVISEVVMNEKKLDDLSVNVDLHDHSARITGDLDFALEASYHLETHDFTASAVFDDTDLGSYFQIARQPGLSGSVNGKIEAKGNSQDIHQIRADMDLSHLDISFKGEEIVRADDIRASVTEGVLSIPGAHIILGRQGWLDIEGTATLHDAVSLTAKGDIPLLVIEPFVEDLTNIEGHVMLTAQMEGTRSSPAIEVDINLEGIGFGTLFIDERLHSTSGRITITPQAVLIEKIAGKLGEGSFNLAGKMELKDLMPERIGFTLDARSLPVRIPDTLDLYADLDVEVEGTPDKSRMQGKAILLEGVYYRDVNLSLVKGLRTMVERRPAARSPRKQITVPFLGNMDLDISIKRRNPLFVDNNLAQLDINPDLKITGTLNNPIINGRAGIESGTVEFRNRIFNVTRGVVDFLNPYKTEASIDLVSEVEVRDWMIYLEVSGSPDALTLSLRSDPEEEDNDILSLLVLGKTSRELIDGEGGSSQSTSAMLAALVSSRYGEDFKEATGLDILEVESEAGQEDSAETVKVTIGKELSRRITLKYAMESKNSELSQRAIAEYKLLENILVNGFQDTRGTFGADVQFKLEFR